MLLNIIKTFLSSSTIFHFSCDGKRDKLSVHDKFPTQKRTKMEPHYAVNTTMDKNWLRIIFYTRHLWGCYSRDTEAIENKQLNPPQIYRTLMGISFEKRNIIDFYRFSLFYKLLNMYHRKKGIVNSTVNLFPLSFSLCLNTFSYNFYIKIRYNSPYEPWLHNSLCAMIESSAMIRKIVSNLFLYFLYIFIQFIHVILWCLLNK